MADDRISLAPEEYPNMFRAMNFYSISVGALAGTALIDTTSGLLAGVVLAAAYGTWKIPGMVRRAV